MKKPLRYAVFAAIAVLVIGVSAAAAIFFNLQNEAAKKQAEQQTPAAAQVDPAEKKANDASKLAYEGDLQAGINALDAAINSSNDAHEKSVLYSQKGILLLNNKRFDDALAAAKQAFDLEQTVDSAAFVGQIARTKGDKPVALDYYKKALALVDAGGDPVGQADKDYYSSIIAEIESGK